MKLNRDSTEFKSMFYFKACLFQKWQSERSSLTYCSYLTQLLHKNNDRFLTKHRDITRKRKRDAIQSIHCHHLWLHVISCWNSDLIFARRMIEENIECASFDYFDGAFRKHTFNCRSVGERDILFLETGLRCYNGGQTLHWSRKWPWMIDSRPLTSFADG